MTADPAHDEVDRLCITGWNMQIKRIEVKPNFLKEVGKETLQHLEGNTCLLNLAIACRKRGFNKEKSFLHFESEFR
jgi:hypothetical protein